MKEAVALLQYCNVYKYKYNPYEHEMLATYAIATTLLVGLIWFSWYSCGRERENSANILSGWDYGEHCIRMQNGQCLAINTALIDGSKRQTANGWTNCDQTRSFCAHVLFRQQFFFAANAIVIASLLCSSKFLMNKKNTKIHRQRPYSFSLAWAHPPTNRRLYQYGGTLLRPLASALIKPNIKCTNVYTDKHTYICTHCILVARNTT